MNLLRFVLFICWIVLCKSLFLCDFKKPMEEGMLMVQQDFLMCVCSVILFLWFLFLFSFAEYTPSKNIVFSFTSRTQCSVVVVVLAGTELFFLTVFNYSWHALFSSLLDTIFCLPNKLVRFTCSVALTIEFYSEKTSPKIAKDLRHRGTDDHKRH